MRPDIEDGDFWMQQDCGLSVVDSWEQVKTRLHDSESRCLQTGSPIDQISRV